MTPPEQPQAGHMIVPEITALLRCHRWLRAQHHPVKGARGVEPTPPAHVREWDG